MLPPYYRCSGVKQFLEIYIKTSNLSVPKPGVLSTALYCHICVDDGDDSRRA